jgi:drug/metabolite transporter (DMT)-like permease
VSHDRRGLDPSQLALLVLGVTGVSMSGPLMAAATMVPALAMSLWRSGLGAAALLPAALTGHRAELTGLARRELVRSGFAGLMLAAHFAFWTGSLKLTSVASATALVCLQVAWVVVLARLAGELVTVQVWLGLVVSMLGVLVVSGVDFSVSARALGGDVMALVGGGFAAVYVTVGGRVRTTASTTTYTFVCYSASAVALAGCCLVAGVRVSGFSARDWLLIAAVTVMSQLLGHSVFNYLLATMSPTVVSMTLLLEVPGAALLAAVFLGQAPPLAVYAGLVLIVVGLGVVVRARSATGAPQQAPVD